MLPTLRRHFVFLVFPLLVSCATPKLPGVHSSMQSFVDAHDVSGVVTVVATKDKIIDCEAVGWANIETKEAMRPDSLFWIASMTKPVTAVALLMLQDEGKLNVSDPVAKYIPEFASLKTPSGKPANLTIAQMMTHTSGLGEANKDAAAKARTLAELVPLFLAAPMQYEPGSRWQYTQSGINTTARIIEIASGMPFDVFVQKRIFDPLGMNDTTFYPARKPSANRVVGYRKNPATGMLEARAIGRQFWCGRSSPAGQWRHFFHRPGLRALLSNAPRWRFVWRKTIS